MKSKAYLIFLRSLAVILAILSLILCLASPIIGIIGIVFSIYTFISAKKTAAKLEPFKFPETDEQGHEMLNIYDLNATGVTHKNDYVDPQLMIPKLRIGERLILEADPTNQYDQYAVKVKNLNGMQLGWLPQGANLQIDVSKRLQEGQTVYARVKDKYKLSADASKWGFGIEIARYSK